MAGQAVFYKSITAPAGETSAPPDTTFEWFRLPHEPIPEKPPLVLSQTVDDPNMDVVVVTSELDWFRQTEQPPLRTLPSLSKPPAAPIFVAELDTFLGDRSYTLPPIPRKKAPTLARYLTYLDVQPVVDTTTQPLCLTASLELVHALTASVELVHTLTATTAYVHDLTASVECQ